MCLFLGKDQRMGFPFFAELNDKKRRFLCFVCLTYLRCSEQVREYLEVGEMKE